MNGYDDNEQIIADSEQVACPNCSGPMKFNPKTQALTCEYCDYEKPLELENELTNYDFFEAESAANHIWGSEINSLHCESCGASSNMSSKDTTLTCPFCGSTHIIPQNSDFGITPHGVVPFELTREDAFEAFEKWIKKRFFAKRAVKDAQDSERLKGVYIPYWQFDVNTQSFYHCQIGYNYTVTVSKTVMENGKQVTKNVSETRIRWEHKTGRISNIFDDELINASRQFNTGKINALEPFDLRKTKAYHTDFLSGFVAQKYEISLNEGFEILKPQLHREIIDSIKRKYHGDHIRAARLSTDYEQVEFRHVLLPIWLSSYRYADKTYQFGINGQTGEVQGNYPLDWFRVMLVVGAIAALIAAYFIYQYSNDAYSLIDTLSYYL